MLKHFRKWIRKNEYTNFHASKMHTGNSMGYILRIYDEKMSVCLPKLYTLNIHILGLFETTH